MMQKKQAFTLAEVLLTMTIVGVVAAMTIPTLHYQRIKKEYTAKLKNFHSKMSNAVLDMELDKGSYRDMIKPANVTEGYNWYMENIDPYMGHQYVNAAHRDIYYKDGSKLYIANVGGCLDVYYDVNGDKGPNRTGYDRYLFLYCFTQAQRLGWFGNDSIFFGVYGSGNVAAGTTRDKMITDCRNGREGEAGPGAFCTMLLLNDQWEFKNDYPFKF